MPRLLGSLVDTITKTPRLREVSLGLKDLSKEQEGFEVLYECLKTQHSQRLQIETDRKWFEKEAMPEAKVQIATEADEENGRVVRVTDRQNDLLISFAVAGK